MDLTAVGLANVQLENNMNEVRTTRIVDLVIVSEHQLCMNRLLHGCGRKEFLQIFMRDQKRSSYVSGGFRILMAATGEAAFLVKVVDARCSSTSVVPWDHAIGLALSTVIMLGPIRRVSSARTGS